MTKVLLTIGGIILCCLGVYLLCWNTGLRRMGKRTKGVVIEIVEETDSDDVLKYYPIVKFSDKSNKEHIVPISRQTSYYISYEVGDTIALIYPENDVKLVRMNTFYWMYIIPFLPILGGLFILRGMFMMDNS